MTTKLFHYRPVQIMFLCFFMLSCSRGSVPDSSEIAKEKIKFDLTGIDKEGLIGPEDGKVSIAYIFYIPAEKSIRKEVARIDPSVRFFARDDQYQCIGEGGNPSVIMKLASLPYILRINRFYGE